jgi:hypothetical protein
MSSVHVPHTARAPHDAATALAYCISSGALAFETIVLHATAESDSLMVENGATLFKFSWFNLSWLLHHPYSELKYHTQVIRSAYVGFTHNGTPAQAASAVA